jgi:hypothetical protein
VVYKWNSIQLSANEFDLGDVNNLLGWACYYVSKGGKKNHAKFLCTQKKHIYILLLKYSNWSCQNLFPKKEIILTRFV